jgi:hypothetical protein
MTRLKDNSPQIHESETSELARIKKPTKKSFTIECRYTSRNYGGPDLVAMFSNMAKWHFVRRYAKKKDRDEALRNLTRPNRHMGGIVKYEYRAGSE